MYLEKEILSHCISTTTITSAICEYFNTYPQSLQKENLLVCFIYFQLQHDNDIAISMNCNDLLVYFINKLVETIINIIPNFPVVNTSRIRKLSTRLLD